MTSDRLIERVVVNLLDEVDALRPVVAAAKPAAAPLSKKKKVATDAAKLLAGESASGSCVTLASLTEDVAGAIIQYRPVTVDGMDPALHYLPPHVQRTAWHALGDLVTAREKQARTNVPGERWISLRLDGSGFSKAVRAMRSRGILEPGGYSERFAAAMVKCLQGLMAKFHAKIGYTQSDGIAVLIPPASVVRGEQQPHTNNERVAKLTTLAAGFVTATFLLELTQMCLHAAGGPGAGAKLVAQLALVAPHFDCRMGDYASWAEARAVLLWRAYDCSVNGSDAVYQIKGSGKQVQGLGKREKIQWLWEQGRLPLPPHQAYGATLVRVRRVVEGLNPKLGTRHASLRGVVERREGPLLEMVRAGGLLLEDEELPAAVVAAEA